QGYEVRVDADAGTIDQQWMAKLIAAFHLAHARAYAHEFPDGTVELVTLGLEAIGLLQPLELTQLRTEGPRPPVARTREVWVAETAGMVPTAIYARQELPAGAELFGPAVIEQEDS